MQRRHARPNDSSITTLSFRRNHPLLGAVEKFSTDEQTSQSWSKTRAFSKRLPELPMPIPAIIRTATTHDAPATLALFRSVVEEGRYTVQEPSEVTITEDEEREYIEADRKAPGHLCLVATVGGVVVGMLRAQAESYRRTRHFADIDSMWVHASWRRRGLARHLLAELIAWAQGHLGTAAT